MEALEREAYLNERLGELKGTLKMISNWMVLPLYFLFWIADIIFVPDHKWDFLLLRACVIPTCFVVQLTLKKIQTFRQGEYLALGFITILGGIINVMIFRLHDFSSPYYAGLNLVALGSLTFVPWSRLFFFIANLVIFIPYLMGVALYPDQNYRVVLVNSFFIVGTVAIAYVIKFFHEDLRVKEFLSRIALNDEIGNRDSIIISKTEEALRLERLSSQFSPQVVQAIKDKKIELDKMKRTEICCLFIDIVNSTERVAYLSEEKVQKSISHFLDDVIRILLKYNITIDKFLGDGILGFSNSPVSSADFAQRVLDAALEVKQQISETKDYYVENWNGIMQIRIGVAVGHANVGFYGSGRLYKSFTALGPVVNLASRLCSQAETNQILTLDTIRYSVDNKLYSLGPAFEVDLKGFNKEKTKVREVLAKNIELNHGGTDIECSQCGVGIMQLKTNASGIYELSCNHCGFSGASARHTKKAA